MDIKRDDSSSELIEKFTLRTIGFGHAGNVIYTLYSFILTENPRMLAITMEGNNPVTTKQGTRWLLKV